MYPSPASPVTATEGRAVVSELGRAAPPLQGTLRRLRLLAPSTVRALPQVRAILCQVNPMAKYLRPYAEDVATLLNNMGSVTNYYDATGHAARIYVTVGPKDSAIASEANARLVNALLATGSMSRTDAYELVKGLAQRALDEGEPLSRLAAADARVTRVLSPAEIEAAFDPAYYLQRIDEAWRRLGLT